MPLGAAGGLPSGLYRPGWEGAARPGADAERRGPGKETLACQNILLFALSVKCFSYHILDLPEVRHIPQPAAVRQRHPGGAGLLLRCGRVHHGHLWDESRSV